MEDVTRPRNSPSPWPGVVIGLYSLALTVLSAVFPFTFVITGSRLDQTLYLQVLGLYLTVGSVLFLTYISVRIYMYKRSGRDEPDPETVNRLQHGTFVYFDGGVNFFMRIGLIVFGLGTAVMQCFRIMAFAEDKVMYECYGLSVLILEVVNIVVTFLQTYFLFKHHNIVLYFHYWLVRLGLAHLFVCNASHWLTTVTFEAWETLQQRRWTLAMLNNYHTNFTTSATFEHLGCVHPGRRVMADHARGYLYPVVIAYCMLSGAVILQLNITTTRHASSHHHRAKETPSPAPIPGGATYRPSSGLYWGLVVFLSALTSVSVFYHYHHRARVPVLIRDIQGLIYMATTLFVSLLGLVALPPALYLLRKLDRVHAEHTHQLNYTLLLFAAAGHYFLLAFMIFPMASGKYIVGQKIMGVSVSLIGCLCMAVDFAESTLQVVYIFYAKNRRCGANTSKLVENLGRSVVTFLFFCNLSQWVVNSMELKESYNSPYFNGYYGDLTWVVILSLFLPMSTFFKFHSGVCLSEVWLQVYQRPQPPQTFL